VGNDGFEQDEFNANDYNPNMALDQGESGNDQPTAGGDLIFMDFNGPDDEIEAAALQN